MNQPTPLVDQIITRTATLEDLDTLLDFEQGVIAAERPLDPTIKKGDIHYYNLPAIAAYEKVGFTQNLIQMWIGLDE